MTGSPLRCGGQAIGSTVVSRHWQAPVHLYFNNDWEVFAPRNATELRRQLDRLKDIGVDAS